MAQRIRYVVRGMQCGHCEAAVVEEISAVSGVEQVRVDLAATLVEVVGTGLDDAAIRAAIREAGYETA